MTSASLPSFAGTPEHIIGPAHVWIKPAGSAVTPAGQTVYSFDWLQPWLVCRRLLPQSATNAAGSTGTASFTLLQRTREENGQKILADIDNVVRGAYVAITLGIEQDVAADGSSINPTWDSTKAIWYGWITDIAATVSQASPSDELGTVTAQELGTLLDAQQLRGWLTSDNRVLLSPPTANYSLADGVIVGNAVDSASGYRVFAADPSACGTATSNYWSRWELLKHVLLVLKPPALTLALLTPSAGVEGFLNDTTVPEVFELEGLTFKGALDMLLPRSRGFGWFLSPTDTNIGVNVYSHDPDGSFLNDGNGNLAANTPVTVATDPALIIISRNESAGDDYDQIVIRGDRHVICGTLGYEYGNVVAGWSNAAETAYRGCPGVILPASPKLEDKLARYQEYRTAPGLERVFAAFRFESVGGEINKADGTAFFPLITWNGSSLSLNTFSGTAPNPSLPTARVERSIPWPKGLQPDGTNYRGAQQIAQPEYLSPRLFRHTLSPPANDAQQWVNLLNPSQSAGTQYVHRDRPDVIADERACGLIVKFGANEALARNHWTDGVDAFSFNAPNTPNGGDAPNYCLDWQWLIFTVAIRSDQRVEVSKTKPGIAAGNERRRLVIEEDGLAFWFVWRDAVLALKQDGSGGMAPWYPTITNTDPTASGIDSQAYIVRNCYPLAERFANMVAAWVFRPRVSISARMAWPDYDRSDWLAIGTMIGSFANQPAVNTVIESITYTLTPDNAGVSFSTTLIERPSLPRLPALAGMTSPSGAGQISVSLGGTVAQAVQRVTQRVERLEAQPQPPIIAARTVPTNDDGLYQITKTAHGFVYGDVVAYSGTAWGFADALNAYEPTGLVLAVDSANVFRVAFTGRHYAPDLAAVSDWTSYYLSPTSPGDYTTETSALAGLPSTGAALRAVFRTLNNGYIEVIGQDADKHDHQFEYARNVLRPSLGLSLGDALTFDPNTFGSGKAGWKSGPAAGSGSATSVLGRAAGSSGTRADIVASADGQVLARVGGALVWTTIGGGTLPAPTFEQLSDVNIASPVTYDYARYDTGTSKWVKNNLGPIVYLSASTQLGFDGGVGGTAMTVGVGASGSRLYLNNVGTALDFSLSGDVAAGTDKAARITSTGANAVSFYDQSSGLVGVGSAGDKVMEWGTFASGSASSRYFRFMIDVQLQDTSTNLLKWHAQGFKNWRVLDSIGNNFLDFYSVDPSTAVASIHTSARVVVDERLCFSDALAGPYLSCATSILKFNAGGGTEMIRLNGSGLGFFGVSSVGQQTNASSVTQTNSGTANAAYVQSDFQKALDDLNNAITAVNRHTTALHNLGLAT